MSSYILQLIRRRKLSNPNPCNIYIARNYPVLFDRGEKAFLLFLDIRDAFETVWHSGLMCKLYDLVLPVAYLDLCTAHTDIRFIVNGTQSRFVNVEMGVCQGIVLSTSP